jgi:protoporphyrin/coproporphyrin ferrochelatase
VSLGAATPTGVLLLTFGSATTADGVRGYLASVRGGRDAPEELVAEFERRYRTIGRSPLVDITEQQAAALQQALDRRHGPDAFVVAAGMLHSAPRVPAAIDTLRHGGARRILAIVLAPQYSPLVLAGYERAIAAAVASDPTLDISVAGSWHLVSQWIDSLAERVESALQRLGPEAGTVPVIFTAHSLPRAVVDRDPGYIEQLRDTARAIAERLELPEQRWQFAFQSAGHTPEEWLRPDVKELLPGLRDAGHRSVLVVPVQFLSDHLEILYDIDVAACEEAAALGITMQRIDLPNTSPTFIAALAAVVERECSRVTSEGG